MSEQQYNKKSLSEILNDFDDVVDIAVEMTLPIHECYSPIDYKRNSLRRENAYVLMIKTIYGGWYRFEKSYAELEQILKGWKIYAFN